MLIAVSVINSVCIVMLIARNPGNTTVSGEFSDACCLQCLLWNAPEHFTKHTLNPKTTMKSLLPAGAGGPT